MLNALPENDVQYHVKDNTLSFSFSGSHIATIKSYSPPLELWAEIRTYYPSPKGRSRKNHIQPDYTLAIEDAYNADRSVAVVECKQYKKYSRKNFLNAAEDYAGGRPQANVFLVNYGTMNPLLKDSVDGKYRDRIQFFGSIQPHTTETIAFRNALKAAIDQYYKNNFKFKISECFFPNKGCTIRLKWSDLPKDLDLHLIITTDTQKYHVAFNQRGSSDNYPFAELGNDDRDGYGNESITISQLLSAKYDIYVHDYYDTGFISGSITVQIETDGQPEYAISRVEPIEKGKLWHPYTIVAGVISPVNEIVDFSESYFSSR